MSDRLPPHDIEMERAVLGSILIDPDAWHDVAGLLEPGHFFQVKHKQIFEAMQRITGAGDAIDFVLLSEQTKHEDDAYLIGLLNVVPTAVQAREYARRVWQLAKRRQLIQAAGVVADAAWNDDAEIDTVFDQAQTAVLNAVGDGGNNEATKASIGLQHLFDTTSKRYQQGGVSTGIMTGFIDIDAILDGFEPGGLYILAGRPAMGKSALEGCIRLNVARAGGHVLSFNLEMPEVQSWQRLVAIDTGLNFQAIRKGKMTPAQWQVFGEGIGRLSGLPMWINDSPSIKPTTMHSIARRHQAMHGLDLITVDYLQLMASNHRYGNRVSEVGDISRGLKQLALSLDVPVLALAQLSRAVESRADKRPQLSDLRDSGDIEQDADVVMFIYRDDYYHEDESERPNQAEVIIAKHRNGPTGTADLYFDKARIRFRDLVRREISL